jgi:uncharacterized membrane protein YoaK (UPF0700 family)
VAPTPAEESLRVAILLSLAGGFLDAFTWVGHGRVFANAQTGNVVLLGVEAARGDWFQALRHLAPIGAFMLGVFVAHRLRVHDRPRGTRRAALISLGVEIVLLLVVATLPPAFPDTPIVLGIAFVAAVQSSSFAKVEGLAYSSVMTTGNLRRAAEFLFAGTTPPRDPVALPRAGVFWSICVSFGLGAAAGALATGRLANVAVLAPGTVLLAVMLLCFRDGAR